MALKREFLSIDEVKRIELNILDTVHTFCEKNDIHYFIEAGTLLGAVRHKGFIPWDDDIDIGMLRKDYIRFIELYPENGINGYKLLSPGRSNCCNITFSKVFDTRTLKEDQEFASKYWKYGVDIDIFPWDKVPDNVQERRKYNRKIFFLFHVFIAIVGRPRKESSVKKTVIKAVFMFLVKMLAFFHIINANEICHRLNCFAMQYNEDELSFACDIVLPDLGGVSKATTIEGLENRQLMEFEDKLYWAPCAYDECLRNAYGDYMKLPPEEQRATHHLSSFYRTST